MNLITVASWDAFQTELEKLKSFVATELGDRRPGYPLLFRGQVNPDWKLEPTLDRLGRGNFTVSDYYRKMYAGRPAIESFTGKRWDLPGPLEYDARLEGKYKNGIFDVTLEDMPIYEYMVYLRHHGFPSPLLDWKRSPYVAAFFAFRNDATAFSSVAIYAFTESVGRGKSWWANGPAIQGLGSYVRTDPRHFLQQCEYTICLRRDTEMNEWRWASHEAVAENANKQQDILWKFLIPASERSKVLRHLNEYNINAYQLFNSEDTLVEATAIREFDLRQ